MGKSYSTLIKTTRHSHYTDRLWLGTSTDSGRAIVPIKNSKSNKQTTTATHTKPVPDTGFRVVSVDLNKVENSTNHHTDQFDIPELVLRRGATFTAKITVSRDINEDTDTIELFLQTGTAPSYQNKSKLSEYKTESREGAELVVSVYIPYTAVIGDWSLTVVSRCRDGDSVQENTYEHPLHVYVIFNPWCKDDDTYMDNDEQCEEYVMNDMGTIYYGTSGNIGSREWNYGQFEEGVLPACMKLLTRSKVATEYLSDAVIVTRIVSRMVNTPDLNGLMVANWGGSYLWSGTPPSGWNSSVKILEDYGMKGCPVLYGQCWIMAAVANTVLRCLGIPCRCVTNFNSVHDSGKAGLSTLHWNSTDGTAIDGRATGLVWNFHVWNEAWMSNSSLPPGNGGWQAFDVTPQRMNGEVVRAGPTSVQAIKNGHTSLGYDTGCFYGEIHADILHCDKDGGLMRREESVAGNVICTKAVGQEDMEDITHEYKHPKGTEDSKLAAMMAHGSASPVPETAEQPESDVEIDVLYPDKAFIGSAINCEVSVENKSTTEERTVTVLISARMMHYTGISAGNVFQTRKEFTLKPESIERVSVEMNESDYIDRLVEFPSLSFTAMVNVTETGQTLIKSPTFRLLEPELSLTVENTQVKQNQIFNLQIKLRNPLNKPLKKGHFTIDALGMQKTRVISHKTIPAREEITLNVYLVPKKLGEMKVLVNFTSPQLHNVCGSLKVTSIEPPPTPTPTPEPVETPKQEIELQEPVKDELDVQIVPLESVPELSSESEPLKPDDAATVAKTEDNITMITDVTVSTETTPTVEETPETTEIPSGKTEDLMHVEDFPAQDSGDHHTESSETTKEVRVHTQSSVDGDEFSSTKITKQTTTRVITQQTKKTTLVSSSSDEPPSSLIQEILQTTDDHLMNGPSDDTTTPVVTEDGLVFVETTEVVHHAEPEESGATDQQQTVIDTHL